MSRPTKPSEEHVFPRWVSALFPNKKFIHSRSTSDNGTKPSSWTNNKEIDIKVKAVCETCNGGWMSDLESGHAKPAMKDMILRLDPVTLTPERIVAISAFAFKTSAVIAAMASASAFFLPAERRRFAKTLEVPPEIHIFVASYFGDRPAASGDLSVDTYNSTLPSGDALELYVATWRAGHFVFQVVNPRITLSLSRKFNNYTFESSTPMDVFVSRIWPPPASEDNWPPIESLGDHSFQSFSNRWSGMKFYGS